MERIADEVKSALKPFFVRNEIDKEEYKDIMRKAVPKVSTDLVCLLLWFFNNYRLNMSVVKKKISIFAIVEILCVGPQMVGTF